MLGRFVGLASCDFVVILPAVGPPKRTHTGRPPRVTPWGTLSRPGAEFLSVDSACSRELSQMFRASSWSVPDQRFTYQRSAQRWNNMARSSWE